MDCTSFVNCEHGRSRMDAGLIGLMESICPGRFCCYKYA